MLFGPYFIMNSSRCIIQVPPTSLLLTARFVIHLLIKFSDYFFYVDGWQQEKFLFLMSYWMCTDSSHWTKLHHWESCCCPCWSWWSWERYSHSVLILLDLFLFMLAKNMILPYKERIYVKYNHLLRLVHWIKLCLPLVHFLC